MPTIRTAAIDHLSELSGLDLPAAPFSVLLALDASQLGVEEIVAGITVLLDAGATYLCLWGTDCERVHEIADEIIGGDGEPTPWGDVATTSDPIDTLGNAADFARSEAIPEGLGPLDEFTLFGLAVGERDWARRMEEVFSAS